MKRSTRPCIRSPRRPSRRRAFTLIEMLVSLAVMAIALAVVTEVFTITTKTAAASAALAEAEALSRSFAEQISADLEGVRPDESILAIVGRVIPAARTADGLAAEQYKRFLVGDPADVPAGFDPKFSTSNDPDSTQYSDPRADILMFLTQRPISTRAPAANPLGAPGGARDFQVALASGTRFTMSQVVYGHAAEADVSVSSGGGLNWDRLTHPEQPKRNQSSISALPLTQWHLGRRVGIFNPTLTPTSTLVPQVPAATISRLTRCVSDDARYAGDSLDGISYLDILAYFTNPLFARSTPYETATYGGSNLRNDAVVNSLLFPGGGTTFHHVATVIDNPPAEGIDNVGVHSLPGCAWFQVEFLMPEDPRNSPDSPLGAQRGDRPRWVQVDPGRTYFFVPDNEENREAVRSQIDGSGRVLGNSRLRGFAPLDPFAPLRPPFASAEDDPSSRIVRLWPWAIRITVRVYDRRGELEEPVIRTLVHRFD